ncbi:5-dehydro-2-deoxygluconokinase [Pseudoalteromonas sp. P1-9]|uniref:carbohydrate kinase family protein n=1 Tax=Pseudoalteromonas sp. P1-9 TaxID=1710354 RepID=UPI0006D64921|nr:carbohydrate kinase [Pseudoalteromonas sp. P1-9]KPV96351.1 5-dehydro-2-deoxygluconokinase [Pseudoalteromonas sp. P1-9]
MSKVICYGEALIDFLQINQHNQEGVNLSDYRQFPGGAPANAAVALAKLGGKSHFVGQVGNDQFGHFLINSLRHYGVNTDCTLIHKSAPTPLAFVHLDAHGERSFTFMRKGSADLKLRPDDIKSQWFTHASLMHFCSNTLTEKSAIDTTQAVLEHANENNLTICFDVNLRANLWQNSALNIPLINEFVKKAHVVKFAREEFELLYQNEAEDYINKCFNGNCELLLITGGGDDIEYITKHCRGSISPAKAKVVDTTAGGDGFIGAILYLLSDRISLSELTDNENALKSAVAFASCAGALAVSRQGAFPALPSLNEVNTLFNQQFSALTGAFF